ncbi:MAG: 4-alpha-glucanotransferase [Bacteroidetes bacterium]|nr:MAG: 4-alpha-glucanotransferase [Bacteroidota bacterium]PIE87754.1 MAG: 4-alpha-glucanotransferase [Bacteroidota bacterium]
MKVLMFGWEFPPHITGGLGTACYGMTKGLVKHDVEVLFVVPKAYGDEDQQAVRLINASDVPVAMEDEVFQKYFDNISYMEIGSNLVPYLGPEEFERTVHLNTTSQEKRKVLKTSDRKFTFSGKYGTNLYEEVSRYALIAASIAVQNDFDVIHAHDWLTYSAGVAAKKASGKPLVVHMHATEFDRSGENVNQIVYDIERNGLQAADRVIAVSNLTRQIVIEKYGVSPEKVFTVHNAVEPGSEGEFVGLEKNVDEKVVTFLGRLTFQKGPEYFIEAAHQVLQRSNKVRFVMAGSGDMMNKLIKRVAQLGISDRFHFTGFLKGADVDKMFALSDVFVMPSVSEPFGIVPLEAMRSNVPVIISKQSGVSEILKHAIKVDFWDVDAMADAIWSLVNYKSLAKIFREHGKAEVDALKWDDAAHKIKDVYASVL